MKVFEPECVELHLALTVDIPGVLKLPELSACGHEVTERVAEGFLQQTKGLKWLRLCAWTMTKGDNPRVS